MSPSSAPSSRLFEQSTESACELDAAGRLLRATAGLARVLGRPAQELAGALLTDLLEPADVETGVHHLARAQAGEVVCSEVQFRGRPAPVAVCLTLLPRPDPSGAPGGTYGLAVPVPPVSPSHERRLERERHLSVIFDNIADVTFVLQAEADGSRFRFEFVNKAFTSTTGLPAEQVVGHLVQDVIPEPSLSQVLQHYHRALQTHQPVEWLETTDYPTGRKLGHVRVTPVLDDAGHCCQLVGIVHDLTAQKQAEEKLRASNERFLYALKATTDALYEWNVAADTLYWGEGFEELFGHQLAVNPTPFSKWADYVEAAEHERVVTGLRHRAFATTSSYWQEEYRFRRADGSWAVVFDRGYLLRDAAGRPVRMIGAMQDITARKQAEEQQRHLAEKLVAQNADLQQFTYIVSHNLRAPLANALGYAHLLAKVERQSPVFEESLKNLRVSVEQLDTVLSDVNGILSIRDRQDGYRPERVPVAVVARQAAASLAGLLQECAGQLHVAIPDALELVGSRAYFHSIFHNLITNAIKYRADDRPLRIDLAASADGPLTCLHVRDNGSGFDQQKAGDDVFQLYQRFHPQQTGRGIGLFLVRAHVESMHGTIRVRSRVGEGTEFTLCFTTPANENVPH